MLKRKQLKRKQLKREKTNKDLYIIVTSSGERNAPRNLDS